MFAYYEWLLLAFPVIAACANFLVGERVSRRGQNAIAMAAATAPLLVILPLLVGIAIDPTLVGHPAALPWIRVWSGSRFVEARFALRLDALSILLTATLLFGGWFVHLLATRSPAWSGVRPVVLAQLSGTLAAVMIVLLADDMLFLVLGWSLSGWLTYGLLCAVRGNVATPGEREHVPILIFWAASDLLLLIAAAVVGRRFASLSIDDLIALSPAPGLQEIPSLSLAAAGTLACVAALLRMGVFPWHLPLSAAAPGWARAMARGLVLTLPSVSLLARLAPLLAAAPLLSTAMAWGAALTALLAGLLAVIQPDGRSGCRFVLLAQASLLLLAIAGGSPLAALAYLPVAVLSQALVLLTSTAAPFDAHAGVSNNGSVWVTGFGVASLVGLPPLGAFAFFARLLGVLLRRNPALGGLALGALFLLAVAGAAVVRERTEQPRLRAGVLWVLTAAIVVLGLASLALPYLPVELLGSEVSHTLDQPPWWAFLIAAATSGVGALAGWRLSAPIEAIRRRIAARTSGWYGVKETWERAVIQPILVLGSFVADTIEPRLARSSLGLLVRWAEGSDEKRGALDSLPALIALLMLAMAMMLLYLLVAR